MYSLLIAIHVIICIILTIVILLQSSKGGGLAGIFGGGGGMGAVFGGRGAASFLSKLTTALAIIFMVGSLILGLMSKTNTGKTSIVSQERSKGNISSPADILPTIPTEGSSVEKTVPIPTKTEDKTKPSEE